MITRERRAALCMAMKFRKGLSASMPSISSFHPTSHLYGLERGTSGWSPVG